MHLLANTAGQALGQHSFAVGMLASVISRSVAGDDDSTDQDTACFIAGALHDIGKADPKFQGWVCKSSAKTSEEGQHIDGGKFSFENHPRHNEISLLLYFLLNEEKYKGVNRANKDRIKHAIYWHHAKPYRKTELKELRAVGSKLKKSGVCIDELLISASLLVDSINSISESYGAGFSLDGLHNVADEDRLYSLKSEPLPRYKIYSENNEDAQDYQDDVITNARNNVVRASVITADRIVSALTAIELSEHIANKTLHTLAKLDSGSDLPRSIRNCLSGFDANYPASKRNANQKEAALSLNYTGGVGVLNGPAGCGKTKIALEWALLGDAKKIIWICPRLQVCQGLLNDLTSSEYLPSARIEINTSEQRAIHCNGVITELEDNQSFSGDIVLTTIDQVISSISTHTKATAIIQYLNAHVVFDEYHEYINMKAFNLLFAELVECKRLQGDKGKALLVSATPNYYFLDELLDISAEDVVGIDSFNESKYKVSFCEFNEASKDSDNPLYSEQVANTFVISNTATTAQKSYIQNQQNERAILFHSSFTKSDKQDVFNKIVSNFGINGSREFDTLRSGPVIQASLNITCDKMITEFTSAENWLQRMGRLDRFGSNTEVNEYITAIPEGLSKSNCARFLASSMYSLESAKAWNKYLADNLGDGPVSISELYDIYSGFYRDEDCLEAVEKDLSRALRDSAKCINKNIIDPVVTPRKKKDSGVVRIKKHSLRGDNRFVQLAECNVSLSGDVSISSAYADDVMTAPTEQITGYGNSKKNLLTYMFKLHHILKSTAKPYNDNVLLTKSRSEDEPIYLSYTPEDLGSRYKPHANAVYYAQSINQPIGSMSINNLTSK